VKLVRDSFDRQHTHISTDIRINRSAKFLSRDLALNLNTRNLAFGMYSGVGASRSVNVNAASINQRQRLGQLTLNSP
jgi:hypothetical protein